MKKTFILTQIFYLLLILSGSAFCEVFDATIYKIQDFSWVDEKETALYFITNNSLYMNLDENATPSISNIIFEHSKHTNISANINPALYVKNITWHKAFYFNLPISFVGIYNEDVFNSEDAYFTKQYSLATQPSLNYTRYFENNFLGVMLSSTPEYQRSDDWNTRRGIQNSGYIQIGIGRIRNGAAAYQAIEMVEELNRKQYLTKQVTTADMEQLSLLIAGERNKFRLEKREQDMEAVEKITTFLIEKQYLAADNLKSILIIDDIYRYIFQDQRKFGSVLYLAAGGTYNTLNYTKSLRVYEAGSLNSRFYPAGVHYEELDSSYEVSLGGEYDMPLNYVWQLDLSGQIRGLFSRKTIHSERFDDYNSEFKRIMHYSPMLKPEVTTKISYLPNTRLVVSIQDSVLGEFSYNQEESGPWSWNDSYGSKSGNINLSFHDWRLKNVLEISSSYSLTYNVSAGLSASWNYAYRIIDDCKNDLEPPQNYTSDQSQKQTWWNINFGLTYRVF